MFLVLPGRGVGCVAPEGFSWSRMSLVSRQLYLCEGRTPACGKKKNHLLPYVPFQLKCHLKGTGTKVTSGASLQFLP